MLQCYADTVQIDDSQFGTYCCNSNKRKQERSRIRTRFGYRRLETIKFLLDIFMPGGICNGDHGLCGPRTIALSEACQNPLVNFRLQPAMPGRAQRHALRELPGPF